MIDARFCTWLILCGVVWHAYGKHGEFYSRSFMFTRPIYARRAIYEQGWHDVARQKNGKNCSGFQCIVLAQHSPFQNRSAEYFTFGGKNCFLVAGDESPNAISRITRDIRAEWLGLSGSTYTTFSLNISQNQTAALFVFEQNFGALFDTPFTRNISLAVLCPLVFMNNKLNVREAPFGMNAPVLAQAFDQPAWCFARIGGDRERFGLAEIRFLLTNTYRADNFFEMLYYSVLSLPTGNKPEMKYLFDPVEGLYGHAAWGGGVTIQFPLNYCTDDLACCFYTHFEGLLLLRRTMKRTFDLRKKPWSRYLLYNVNHAPPVNIPGVNLLTFDIVSHPYGIMEATMGWRLHAGPYEWEIGYTVWGYGDERVNPSSPLIPYFGIAGAGVLPNGIGATSSGSTIGQRALDDELFVPVMNSDIDWASGSVASALNQQGHCGMSVAHHGALVAGFFGVGMYADIAQKNSSLFSWGGWIKIGATF